MKRIKYGILLVLACFALSSCGQTGQEAQDSDILLPEAVAEQAFDSTEDEFFELFQIDQGSAGVEADETGSAYTLSEDISLNGKAAQVIVEFEDGIWCGITYQVVFEGGDAYLEDAYQFSYEYDSYFCELYGEPLDYGDGTFLERCGSYEDYLESVSNSMLSFDGDIYELEGGEMLSVLIGVADETAVVTIQIYPYKGRSISQ